MAPLAPMVPTPIHLLPKCGDLPITVTYVQVASLVIGVGGIDKNSTSVFFEKILRYYYIPTIGVADLQTPLNNMLRSS